jgi:competence protein ComEC
MANENERPRTGGRAAVIGGRRAPGIGALGGDLLQAAGEQLASAFRAEAEAARLAPWLPVFFGIGIIFYFVAPAEPSSIAAAASFLALAFVVFLSRARPVAFAISLALAATAAGFAAGTLRGAFVAHPVLLRPTATLTLAGFVEARDATDRSDRIVLQVTSASGRGADHLPPRVRVSLRRGSAPEVGSHVEMKARLRPLLSPTRPGGYDYALGAYFARLGATGFGLGKTKAVAAPMDVPADIRLAAAIERVRRALTARIVAVIPGQTGAVGTALISGVRDQISAEVNEAMRISGLYHVLSISGLHMAIVVGFIFAAVRGGLALIPGLALRFPIKKWTAVLALLGAFIYMLLAGADAPTLRSFIMIALVLLGVLFDRPAITLRTLSIAAFAVLTMTPEAVLNPGFQMSFAATLALVSIYQRLAPALLTAPPAKDGGAVYRVSVTAGRWLLAGALTSLLAGLATTPYAVFHFQRLAPYGILANVLAMPVISFVIMPMAVVGCALIPFGYDALAWQAMGWGIDVMLAIARWVTALPGAEGRVHAFGTGALLLMTVGLLLLAIPVSKLRFLSAPLFALGLILAITTPKPDVLIDSEAEAVAVRASDGRLTILGARQNRISAESWLAADGDTRKSRDALEGGFRCDRSGCIARLPDGTTIAIARRPEAFADDCREAALVVSPFDVPPACAAAAIDRRALATTGAVALRRVKGEWVATPVRSPTADRPWYGRTRAPDPAALARLYHRPSVPAGSELPLARPSNDPPSETPDEENVNDEE